MKISKTVLILAALATGACSPKRLSPTVLQDTPTPSRSSKEVAPVAARPTSSAPKMVKAKTSDAARQAELKRRASQQKRLRARKMALASFEAGRQLLRESQNESALRAFQESVKLNSKSVEAWMGLAYVCELTGKTKDAIEAFREAKKLWGM